MGQGTHAEMEGLPERGLKEPAGQDWHADALVAPCVALYVPGEQALQAVLKLALQEPKAQQTPAFTLLYTFAAQLVQEGAPLLLKVPAAQLAQDAAPLPLNVPALQMTHAVDALCAVSGLA